MRRFSLLALCLWAPAALAQVRTAPVQLSLDFHAPTPSFTAPLSISPLAPLAPVSLTPSLGVAPSFAPIPAPVIAAFHSGDPAAFVKAARKAEYEPPEGDEHQNALYQLGLQREAADKALLALDHPEPAPARTTKIDYDEFGRQLSRSPGLSTNVFQHTDAKRRILKASGYTRLYGAGGVPVPIDRAADVRVGKTFANVLRAFERR